jgi:hypothetical protein
MERLVIIQRLHGSPEELPPPGAIMEKHIRENFPVSSHGTCLRRKSYFITVCQHGLKIHVSSVHEY